MDERDVRPPEDRGAEAGAPREPGAIKSEGPLVGLEAGPPPRGELAILQQGPLTLTFFVLLLCSAATSLIYCGLTARGLEQGAALFIGLPVILGTIIAFASHPRSTFGLLLKSMALVLCVIAPLLGEGAICIAMAAPLLFGLVGLAAGIGKLIEHFVGRNGAACLGIVVGLSPMLWDAAQKGPGWQDARPLEEQSDSVIVAGTPQQVWQRLHPPADLAAARVPDFLRLRLRAGERWARGGGLHPGDEWHIRFDNDLFIGTVAEARPGEGVRFTVREESAHAGERIALWLSFAEVSLLLRPVGESRTEVTQVTRYRRLLDPGFYFGPLERLGVQAMHRYTLALLLGTPAL